MLTHIHINSPQLHPSQTHLPLSPLLSFSPPMRPTIKRIRILHILRNDARPHRQLIIPPIIVQVRLPAPKHPPVLHLIRLDLGAPPIDIKLHIGSAVRQIEIVLVRRRGRDAPLADNQRPISAKLVRARGLQVAGLRGGRLGFVLDVAVVVVGHEGEGGEVGVRVSGAPASILWEGQRKPVVGRRSAEAADHHLDAEVLGCRNIVLRLDGADGG